MIKDILIHHSRNGELTLESIRTVKQVEYELKPSGIWFSPQLENGKSEWETWVNESGCGFDGNPHQIVLRSDSNLLSIETVEDLKRLDREYSENVYSLMKVINWQKISQDYDGLLVSNYHQIKYQIGTELTKHLWFYALDVNGGCVWNPQAIGTEMCIRDSPTILVTF